ncbi:YdcF family protein [Thomasclavelia cocleata]|uniref:YdcF family protein n=1 Tax=Thomasclavelia cocleata TaxID=69824 RepID=UPI0024302BF0|nr:YdcF family protein [Thomasclavelia cocleata]
MKFKKEMEILWKYLKMNGKLEKASCIVGFGCHDILVAKRASELYLKGYANKIIFTGGYGRITKKIWNQTEAGKFREVAINMGVLESDILLEDKSRNTSENIKYTKEILKNNKIDCHKIIFVDKPYKERRTYATLKKQWHDIDMIVTSIQMSFQEYYDHFSSAEITQHEFISLMVGELQRIDLYSKKGFTIPQKIPNHVWQAFEKLVEAGFTEHIIKI